MQSSAQMFRILNFAILSFIFHFRSHNVYFLSINKKENEFYYKSNFDIYFH